MQKLKLGELHQYSTEVLTKEQMKKVLGGLSSGLCYLVNSGSNTSCWYATSGNADTLCERVYPNGDDPCIINKYNGTGECGPGCHMN